MGKRALKASLREARRKMKKWRQRHAEVCQEFEDFKIHDASAYQREAAEAEARAKKAEARANELAHKLADRSEQVGRLRGRVQELETQGAERRSEVDKLRREAAEPHEWRDRARSMEAEVRRLEEATKDKGKRLDEMREAHARELATMRRESAAALATTAAERDGAQRAFHSVGDALRELVRERDELARAKTDGAIGNLFGALADAVTRAHRAAFGPAPAPAANDATEAPDPAPKRKVPRRPTKGA